MPVQVSSALQEDALTLLSQSDEYGRIIYQTMSADLFEGEYRLFAKRCIDFWREHKTAPGIHIDSILADILEGEDTGRARVYSRIINMTLQAKENINGPYVISKLGMLIRLQSLKQTMLASAEKLNRPGEHTVEEVEALLYDILRARDLSFSPGTWLHDSTKLTNYLESHYLEFTTGIRQLDDRNIVPARKELMMFVGGAGLGKTWFLVQIGKQGLMQRKKVLHISLEMSEEQVMQRYYQCMFSVTKYNAEVDIRVFERSKNKVINHHTEPVLPEFTFASNELQLELNTRLIKWGDRMSRVLIKQFPSRSLTPDGLHAYLDSLETISRFVPDLLIIDYPAIMNIDIKNPRMSIIENVMAVRSIAVERNMAAVAVHQSSKEGVKSGSVKGVHMAEAWQIVGDADQIISYSSTEHERKLGLGRLLVDKARHERDKWSLLLTQSFELGQFVLDSHDMPEDYKNGRIGGSTDAEDD